MNLLFRFFRVLLFSRFRKKLGFFEEGQISFCVAPTDLDALFHMNNGKYFSLLDLGRIDYLIRSGLWRRLYGKKWYPVVVSETMRFRRSLKLFNHFTISTRILGIDDKYVYVEQKFSHKEQLYGLATIKAQFLKKEGGTVNPTEILQLAGFDEEPPLLPDFVSEWNSAEKKQISVFLK